MASEVEEVYVAAGVLIDKPSWAGAMREAGDVDTALITLHFAGGALGVIDNSREAVYGYDQRVEVFGSGGCVAADNRFPNTVTLSDGQRVQSDLPLNFFMDRYTESYVGEIRAFVDCIVHDTQPPVSGLDGRAAVVMGFAAERSYEEKRLVKLSEVE